MENTGKNYFSNRYFGTCIFFFVWLFSHIDKLAMTMALPFVGKELHLSPSALGIAMSSFFAGYSLIQIPAGWLTDQYGSKKVATISIGLFGLFALLTGYAWALLPLVMIRFIFGLGEGGLSPATFRWIAENFPRDERARANGVIFSTNGIGLLLAPLLIAPMIHWLGWRNMFVLTGGIVLFIAIMFWAWVRSPENNDMDEWKEKDQKIPYKELIKNPAVMYVAVAWFGICLVNWGFLSWYPTYLFQVQKISLIQTGIVAALPGLGGVLAIVATGWFLDQYFLNREKYVGIAATLVAGVCLVFMSTLTSLPSIVAFQVLLMFCLKIGFIVIWTIPTKAFREKEVGSATGFVNFIGQMASFLAPMLMGSVIGTFGGAFQAGFLLLALGTLISIFGFMGIKLK